MMAETLERRVSMTGAGIRNSASATAASNQINIEVLPEAFGLYAVTLNSQAELSPRNLSWTSWAGFRAASMGDLGSMRDIEEEEEWQMPTRHSPPIAQSGVLYNFVAQHALTSPMTYTGDLTIIHVDRESEPVREGLSSRFSNLIFGADLDRLRSIDRGSSTTRALADFGWSNVLPKLGVAEHVSDAATDVPAEFADALADLTEIVEESEEKGFIVPTESAYQLAEQLLYSMYAISPRRFEVYPMPKGEIAIDSNDGHGRRIVVFCEPLGSLKCLTNDNGKRDSYSDSNPLGTAGPFIREALEAFL